MTRPTDRPSTGATTSCESCGMPLETGRYCTHCTTDAGELQPFEERFGRMVAWQQRRHPEQSRADAEAATLTYLATMPAWRDHPRVAELARSPIRHGAVGHDPDERQRGGGVAGRG